MQLYYRTSSTLQLDHTPPIQHHFPIHLDTNTTTYQNHNHNNNIMASPTTQTTRASQDAGQRRPVRSSFIPCPATNPTNRPPRPTVRRDVQQDHNHETQPSRRQSGRKTRELRRAVHPQGRGTVGRHVEQVHKGKQVISYCLIATHGVLGESVSIGQGVYGVFLSFFVLKAIPASVIVNDDDDEMNRLRNSICFVPTVGTCC